MIYDIMDFFASFGLFVICRTTAMPARRNATPIKGPAASLKALDRGLISPPEMLDFGNKACNNIWLKMDIIENSYIFV